MDKPIKLYSNKCVERGVVAGTEWAMTNVSPLAFQQVAAAYMAIGMVGVQAPTMHLEYGGAADSKHGPQQDRFLGRIQIEFADDSIIVIDPTYLVDAKVARAEGEYPPEELYLDATPDGSGYVLPSFGIEAYQGTALTVAKLAVDMLQRSVRVRREPYF